MSDDQDQGLVRSILVMHIDGPRRFRPGSPAAALVAKNLLSLDIESIGVVTRLTDRGRQRLCRQLGVEADALRPPVPTPAVELQSRRRPGGSKQEPKPTSFKSVRS